jgi:beta-phosphoglucomutase-like phosphatase (HAD superfamily)
LLLDTEPCWTRAQQAVFARRGRVFDLAAKQGGLADAFDPVLGFDDVESPKPSPHLNLHACELLGVPPARAVALEDSPPGVAAARAAGLLVVGVPPIEGVELTADVVAPSLGDPRVRAALGLDEPAA